jgi:Family of unknown function (DUF5681)
VVDRAALEMRSTCKRTGGSNPSLSANELSSQFQRIRLSSAIVPILWPILERATTGERERTMDAENSGPKQRGRPFKPGQSGNPAGKPKGARNRSTIAAELLLEGEAKALTRKAIELGLAGDTTALRLCLERLVPPRKDRPISLDLPAIKSTEDVAGQLAQFWRPLAGGGSRPAKPARSWR